MSGVEELAVAMWTEARSTGQAARWVEQDADAAKIRGVVRRLARDAGVRIRTARVDRRVVVVRADAELWRDTTAVMRDKLSPRDRP